MKNLKKLCIFVILSLIVCMAFSTVVFATETAAEAATDVKLDMDMKPESFAERAELALQGTVTGMVMIFAVLGLLAIIVSISGKLLNRDKNKEKNVTNTASQKAASAPTVTEAPVASEPSANAAPVAAEAEDGELVAVITAAIAAMIESGDCKNEFVGGFRVVSFKRTTSGAWNRK